MSVWFAKTTKNNKMMPSCMAENKSNKTQVPIAVGDLPVSYIKSSLSLVGWG